MLVMIVNLVYRAFVFSVSMTDHFPCLIVPSVHFSVCRLGRSYTFHMTSSDGWLDGRLHQSKKK